MKDGPLSNFFGVVVKGCGVLFIAQFAAVQFDAVTQSRFYRDLYGITPFYDVAVYGSIMVPSGISVFGEMKKRRCEFADLLAFAERNDRPRVRAHISTSAEDARGVSGNRAPSADAQSWGPWFISWPPDEPTPDGWSIYAGHWCPIVGDDGIEVISDATGKPHKKYEINRFANGPWITTAP